MRRKQLNKILAYEDLKGQSIKKEKHITDSFFYKVFGNKEEQKKNLAFQVKVTKRIESRISKLIKELK